MCAMSESGKNILRGDLILPDRPGIGFELDEHKLEQYAVKR